MKIRHAIAIALASCLAFAGFAHAQDKIDKPAPRHTFIHTRYGVGYKLEPLAK